MITFFRNIRQNVLSEGKTGRYIKYAIGEIVLVVIGILIALQINNWNEERKASNRENKLFQQILIDLENENIILDAALSYYKQHTDLYYHIHDESIGEANHDSTAGNYNLLRWHNIFDLTVTNKHKNNISAITNAHIIELLNEKVDIESDVLKGKQGFNNLKDEIIIPFLIRHEVYDGNAIFNSEKYDFWPLMDINFIRMNRLNAQEVSSELNQILVELKIQSSWAIVNIDELMNKNDEISMTLREELNEE